MGLSASDGALHASEGLWTLELRGIIMPYINYMIDRRPQRLAYHKAQLCCSKAIALEGADWEYEKT